MKPPTGAPLPGGRLQAKGAPTAFPSSRDRARAKGAPTAFPKPANVPDHQVENKLYNVRMCQKCGREGRVVSNHNGIHIFCFCGFNWPISSTALNPSAPLVPARGFSKVTMLEPDYNKAFDEIGTRQNESIGPKPRG